MNFPGERPRWGWIHILLIPVGVISIQFLWYRYGPDLFSYLIYGGILEPTPVADFVFNYLLYFAFFAISIGAALLIAYTGKTPKGKGSEEHPQVLQRRRAALDAVGFRATSFKDFLTWGLGGGVGLFVAVMAIGIVIQWLVPEIQPQPFEDALRGVDTIKDLVVMILVGSVMAPLVEEVYFRGMVYPVIRRYLGISWGILLSGVFFGMLHWDLVRTIPLAMGGMVLAYIYERSRSIYAPWLAHGIWNGIMAVMVFLGQA